MTNSPTIELIGVPFDGWGRSGAQARAASALRAAGLAGAFAREIVDPGDPVLPAATPDRARGSGLMNEPALLAMAGAVHARVAGALAEGRFPFVCGGDCTVLLGAVPALRDHIGDAGLLSFDAHEDTTPLDASPDGEAANMEIGLLLGLTGQIAPEPLRRRLPALADGALALAGVRDDAWRRSLNVASLAARGVLVQRDGELAADPAAAGRAAAERAARAAGWWLHLDVDVLALEALGSSRVPGDQDAPGGLTWPELADALAAALAVGGCRGWSVAIYDPDQDPGGGDARRIVQLVRELAPLLPTQRGDVR